MKWSPEAELTLRDCFGTKDWDHNGNLQHHYINFFMNPVPVKTVYCYANNSPWIRSDIKGLQNQKKSDFKDGDPQELKHLQGNLQVQFREAKEKYSRMQGQKLQNNNMKEVWDGMKIITGCRWKMGATIKRWRGQTS